jgi:hypothetical protein
MYIESPSPLIFQANVAAQKLMISKRNCKQNRKK